MNMVNVRYSTTSIPAPRSISPVLRLFLCLILTLGAINTYQNHENDNLPSLLRQTSPLPIATLSTPWVNPQTGGNKVYGPVTINMPAGFAQHNDATVIGDTVNLLTSAGKAPGIVPGTEFALGIWVGDHQMLFQKPLQLRFEVDAVKVPPGEAGRFGVKMYKPADDQWVELPSEFDSSRYAFVVSVKEFTPVPENYELGWGWRTFFGVFQKEAKSSNDLAPTANRNSNLRSGPGTNYPITGVARAGTSIEPVGKTADGRWYQLRDERWIAASLIDNAPDVPIVRSTPSAPARRTATPTPRANATSTPTPNLNSVIATAIAATLTARAPTPTPDVQSIIATSVAATLTAEAPKPKP